MSDLGIHGIVIQDEDDSPYRFRRLIVDALFPPLRREVIAALEAITDQAMKSVLEYLLREARRPISVEELAQYYGRHPKTLRVHLRQRGFPSTQTLIGWVRLFHAATLLTDPGRSVEQVALAMDYSSASAFRQQLRRYVGCSPSELALRGGVGFLIEEFRKRSEMDDWQVGSSHLDADSAG